jgi:hypothetical protein
MNRPWESHPLKPSLLPYQMAATRVNSKLAIAINNRLPRLEIMRLLDREFENEFWKVKIARMNR